MCASGSLMGHKLSFVLSVLFMYKCGAELKKKEKDFWVKRQL